MKILFVCIGNICRSPIAEGVLKHLAEEKLVPWQIDSAGTHNYHVGEPPHSSSIKVCKANKIDIHKQQSRQITLDDLTNFDRIYTLATDVHQDVLRLCTSDAQRKKVTLFLEELYPGQQKSVKDPWYGTYPDYEEVFAEITEVCKVIIRKYS
jgi:protein-tyrosine phosphatase